MLLGAHVPHDQDAVLILAIRLVARAEVLLLRYQREGSAAMFRFKILRLNKVVQPVWTRGRWFTLPYFFTKIRLISGLNSLIRLEAACAITPALPAWIPRPSGSPCPCQ